MVFTGQSSDLSDRFDIAVDITDAATPIKRQKRKRLFDSDADVIIQQDETSRDSGFGDDDFESRTMDADDSFSFTGLAFSPDSPVRRPLARLSNKKRRLENVIESPEEKAPKRMNLRQASLPSFANNQDNIKLALDTQETSNLTGDFCRQHCLPTVRGKHSDLRSITPETMSDLMSEKYAEQVEEYIVVDCRYPYEFDGGHFPGAKNLYKRDQIETLLDRPATAQDPTKRYVIVFHCEFSSERGPKMARFLRSQDRLKNAENYPKLCYPEIYLLDGGYKNFYEQCPEYELTYKPMLHKDHEDDLRHFRSKGKCSKSRKTQSRRNLDLPRTGLKF